MENDKENGQKELFNYEEEANKLQEGLGDYWSPSAGKYTVTPLTNPEKYTINFEGKNGENETREKIRFQAEVAEKDAKVINVTYQANINGNKDSHFGQLMRLGKANGGLVGKPFTLWITGEGKKRRYNIMETADLS